jgi:hypothetical protein
MKLLVAALLLSCTNQRDNPQPPKPEPAGVAAAPVFSVEFRRITKHPTCLGNERVKVDDHGAVFTATNQADCAAGNAWSTPYPAAPRYRLSAAERDQLGRLIQSSGAMTLPALSTDPAKATSDGYREELDIVLDGRHAVVAVEDTQVAAFSRVRQALIDLSTR